MRRQASLEGEQKTGARNSLLSSYQNNPHSSECPEDLVFELSTTTQTEFFGVVTNTN